MKHLHEIRVHGRGGQGVKSSAKILGRAAFLEGYFTQDFAIYGAERQGAPVTSFVRIDKKPIRVVGYIEEPEHVIILDETIGLKHPLKGVHKNTIILINSPKKQNKKNFYSINATQVALKAIGKPIPNIALLGAFVKLCDFISFNSFKEAVKKEMVHLNEEMIERNLQAARKCFEEIK